jgi:hypothetical protein
MLRAVASQIGGGFPGSFTSLTVTEVASFADGTAANPSAKVGGEQNGLFSPAANALGGAAGGVEVWRAAVGAFTVTGSLTVGEGATEGLIFGDNVRFYSDGGALIRLRNFADTTYADMILRTFDATTITASGAFGCNGATAQGAASVGAAPAAYATGVFGLDSSANMQALHALVVAMRAALVANGIAVT